MYTEEGGEGVGTVWGSGLVGFWGKRGEDAVGGGRVLDE